MNTDALILMIAAESTIAFLTLYFFIRVLTSKKKEEPDSYSENDNH